MTFQPGQRVAFSLQIDRYPAPRTRLTGTVVRLTGGLVRCPKEACGDNRVYEVRGDDGKTWKPHGGSMTLLGDLAGLSPQGAGMWTLVVAGLAAWWLARRKTA